MFARAASSMASVMSTPMTRPVGPTLRAARMRSSPAPEPRSSTVSPGATSLKARGLPHPKLLASRSSARPAMSSAL